jgi:beta-lactamase class D
MKHILAAILVISIATGCVRNNVKEKPSYKTIFEKYKLEGCFAAYDNVFNEFSIYNLSRFRDSSYSPASTFKIVNSLIGLETGNIIEKEVKKWDGRVRNNVDWDKDLVFAEAFSKSAVWYFQDVARKIGKDTMQRYLDSLSYGSKKIIGGVDSFWLNNTLTIKPDEQMGLVKKLYFNQMSNLFSNRTMNAVKDAMLVEKTDKYALSYKTGLTTGKNGKPLAWIVGWIEYGGSKPKVNTFVLNVEGNLSFAEMITTRKSLLYDLLKEEKLIL